MTIARDAKMYVRYDGKFCDYCDCFIGDLKDSFNIDVMTDPLCVKYKVVLDCEYCSDIDGIKFLRCEDCVKEYRGDK